MTAATITGVASAGAPVAVALMAAALTVALGAVAVTAARLRRLRHAVAVAEHELRGPLGAVRLGIELGLRRGGIDGGELRAIASELARTGPALADLAAVRSGGRWGGHRRETPRGDGGDEAPGSVDVGELLRDSVRAWGPSAAAAGVRIELAWTGGGGWVPGDRARLAQATGNLIANAITHGGGHVRVGGSTQGAHARVWVRDDGGGLPARAIERASSRSRRGRRHRHGHGLAIAAAVARLHGGRLTAHGRGSAGGPAEVVLELPAAPRA